MERVNRVGHGVRDGIRKRVVVHERRRHRRRLRDDEGLFVEAADEGLAPAAVLVGFDGALIPGQPERRVRHLGDEHIEFGLRRQPLHRDVHHVDRALGANADIVMRSLNIALEHAQPHRLTERPPPRESQAPGPMSSA